MPYKFEAEVRLNESRDVVWSWLLDSDDERVLRLEMSREYLEDHYGTHWSNRREVAATFSKERTKYLARAEAAAKVGVPVVQILNRQ